MTPDELFEEQGLWAAAMRSLSEGDRSGLVALLRRGRPVSPEVADFVGAMVAGAEIGGYAFSFDKVRSRGAPKNDEARQRQLKALYLTFFLVQKGKSKSAAAREASGIFNVDHGAVLLKFNNLGLADLSQLPGFAEAVAEAGENPGK